ncbi:hypothetical protein ACA910_004337 [Epithemia clementina (nom. ined.)]
MMLSPPAWARPMQRRPLQFLERTSVAQRCCYSASSFRIFNHHSKHLLLVVSLVCKNGTSFGYSYPSSSRTPIINVAVHRSFTSLTETHSDRKRRLSEAKLKEQQERHAKAKAKFEEWDRKEQQAILKEAAYLARCLYRSCFRSARLLRTANEQDEKEFKKREEREWAQQERLFQDRKEDPRLDFITMLPPVDRGSELKSRHEYYCEYTRDQFVSEQDIFSYNDASVDGGLDGTNLTRFLHFLQRGDEHRRWLLKDMKFHDPYARSTMEKQRIQRFKEWGEAHLQERERRLIELEGHDTSHYHLMQQEHDLDEDDGDDDSQEHEDLFKDDEDEAKNLDKLFGDPNRNRT